LVSLRPKLKFTVPVVADCINPDVFAGKNPEEIGKLVVWEGNRKRFLKELFEIEIEIDKEKAEDQILILGDVSKVRMIGAGMTKGEIIIRGNVGMHLGERMSGGKITVHGNVDSWVGSMMKGGTIEIEGDAGDYLGAPYRGSTKGMSGGKITVHGNVGNEAGAYMRKGTIIIYGSAGQFLGLRMKKGTILVRGNTNGRTGACMTGGKIVVCGAVESVLPSFTFERIKKKAKVEEEKIEGPFYLFTGDLSEGGRGQLYVSKEKNPQLSFYEKLL